MFEGLDKEGRGAHDLGEWTRDEAVASIATDLGAIILDGTKGRLHALDVADGSVRWTFQADAEFAASPAHDVTRVYLQTVNGSIYAIDILSGISRWHTCLPRSRDATVSLASPCISDGILLAAHGNTVHALDAGNGSLLWHCGLERGVAAALSAYNSAGYLLATDATLYALDAKNGQRRWTFSAPDAADVGRAHPQPAAIRSDNLVVFVSKQATMYALDAGTGEIVWQYRHSRGREISTLTIWHGRVYAGSIDGLYLCCNDLRTGAALWSETADGVATTSVIFAEGRIYFGTPGGTRFEER